MVKNNKREPYHHRPDLHITWVGAVLAILIGAGAWLGVPGMIIPMALLALAWIGAVAYVVVMIPSSHLTKSLLSVFVTAVFAGIAFLFWNVFTVSMKVVRISGYAYPRGGEELRFAVELINKGKATSLRNWRSQLIDPNGQIFEGEPLRMSGESVEIVDADQSKTLYALPECDLRFETVRVLQTGDSAYGIIDFLFRGYPAQAVPLDMKVKLEATDMLGRTITIGAVQFSEVNKQPADVFPCRELKPQ